jgi:hypothetical protein
MPGTAGDRHRGRLAAHRAARQRAYGVLMDNENVPFVQRIMNPNDYPVMRIGDKDATVLLGTAGFDGKHWVFPNIAYEGGQLVRSQKDDKGWARRMVGAGNAIPFDSLAEANEFAEGSWKQLIGSTIPRKPTGAVPVGRMEMALRAAQAGSPITSGLMTPGSWPGRP